MKIAKIDIAFFGFIGVMTTVLIVMALVN